METIEAIFNFVIHYSTLVLESEIHKITNKNKKKQKNLRSSTGSIFVTSIIHHSSSLGGNSFKSNPKPLPSSDSDAASKESSISIG